MSIQTINGAALRDMFLCGAALLDKNKEHIDALNVFPVPDGDTGTNMTMTMHGAIKPLVDMEGETSCQKVMDAVSSGALRGARGNSGVILSQLFRGFAKSLKGSDSIDAKMLANALFEGSQAAYKAVMKPREGTILTVARMVAEAAVDYANGKSITIDGLLRVVIESGERALALTPSLLPVLKEAGVVDSGGKGLLIIYRGFYAAWTGEEAQSYDFSFEEPQKQNDTADLEGFDTDSIEFGYCTEFFIVRLVEGFGEKDLNMFRNHLMRIGDSVVVASDDAVVKVHVHSNCPGKILQLAMRFGELDRLKIENMREQNRQLLESRRANRKELAMVAVSTGEGVDSIFRDLAVSRIISGGQSMNPSIDTIVNAVKQVNAKNVFVLPNNSNIILAAEQARELCDCNVYVLPTKTIPQGIAAAISFNIDDSVEDNLENMTMGFEAVVSGAVTFAVRDTQFNGKQIANGDIIGILDSELCVVGTDVETATVELVEQMTKKKGEDDGFISLFYGDAVSDEAANELLSRLEALYPDAQIVMNNGGQPLYYYYISVE